MSADIWSIGSLRFSPREETTEDGRVIPVCRVEFGAGLTRKHTSLDVYEVGQLRDALTAWLQDGRK